MPEPSDFSPDLQLTVTAPASSHQAVNVVILLHGLGDSNKSFTNLGRQLSLPETACISLQAPTPLPFEIGGFHWGDDIVIAQTTGQIDFDTGFQKASMTLTEEAIRKGLVERCGYRPREILLFGSGQGGMAALAASVAMAEELRGVILVGGLLPATRSTASAGTGKSKTPGLQKLL
ncbi:MAG: alpha beta-hydrolase [Lasallia pustulata]|uniref:Alpha beta-hydrolase n=1 Tax=Lasallia pustulata TaxID=136370 RepID=A0A5M8PVR8_9LECA|nr:MAG: alpha beta-hydrolase [Lasallia pustulata]